MMKKPEPIIKYPDYLDDRKRTKILRFREYDEETPVEETDDEIIEAPKVKKNLVGQRQLGGRDNLSHMSMTNMP